MNPASRWTHRVRLTATTAVIAVIAALLPLLGLQVAVAPAAHADTGQPTVMDLSVPAQFTAGTAPTVTVHTDTDISGTGLVITIFGGLDGRVWSCNTGSVCSVPVTITDMQQHGFIAYLTVGDPGYNWPTNYLMTSNTAATQMVPYVVSLTTDKTSFSVGEQFTLTATANETVTGMPYEISIFDVTGGGSTYVQDCKTGTACTASLTYAAGPPHVYRAYVAPFSNFTVGNPVAISGDLTITRNPWSIALTTDKTMFGTGGSFTLTATTNQQTLNSGYDVTFWDDLTNTYVGSCAPTTSLTCTYTVSYTTGPPHSYDARVAVENVNTHNLTDLQVTSNQVVIIRQPWTLTLTNASGALTATANQNVQASGYEISIWDLTTNTALYWCYQGTTCTATAPNFTDSYIAYVSTLPGTNPPTTQSDIQADSNGFSSPTGNGIVWANQTIGGGSPAETNPQCLCAEPVNTATGEYFETLTDLTLPGRAPVTWSRTYSSNAASTTNGALGYGWAAPFTMHLVPGTNPGDPIQVVQENGSVTHFTPQQIGTTLIYSTLPQVHATLSRDSNTGAWTFVRRNDKTFTFTSDGRLTSITDRNGETITLTYATGNTSQLATVATPDGRTLTFTYTNGRITTVAATGGRSVSYGYDTNGDLHTFTDSRGKTWTYTYDTSHRLTDITTPLGETQTHNVYDSQGRVTSQTNAAHKTSTFTYTDTTDNGAALHTAVFTDPTGVVTKMEYVNGWEVRHTVAPGTPGQSVTTYQYDAAGNQTQVTDPTNVITQDTYDNAGNKLTETVAAGPANTTTGAVPGTMTTQWTYNAFNEPLTQVDQAGHQQSWTYDSHGNMLTASVQLNSTDTGTTQYDHSNSAHPGDIQWTTDPRGKKTSYTYTAEGFVASKSVPAGSQGTGQSYDTTDTTLKTSYTYDPYGDVLTTVDPRGNATGANAATYTTTNTYDGGGLLTSTKTPSGLVTSYGYDDDGRATTVTKPGGRVTTKYLNADGTVDHVTDALTHTVATYTYDDAGRVLSVKDAVGNVTKTTYDSHGRKATVTQPSGNVSGVTTAVHDANTTTYAYDAADRLVSSSIPDPNGGAALVTQTVYDAAGRVWKQIDPAGDSTVTAYDALNRVASVTDPNGNATVYGYDWAGRKTSVTDRRGKVWSYTYDLANNLTKVVDPLATTAWPSGRTTNYTYDDQERRLTVVDPRGNTTTYYYDPVGNLQTTKDALGHTTSTTYDQDNRVASKINGLTHTTQYGYDATTGRLSTITAPAGGVTTYGYDAADRRTSIASPKGTWITGYDDASEVTSTKDPALVTTTYTYTSEGLVKTKSTARGTITYSYDTLRRPLGRTYSDSTPTVAFNYDRAGRRNSMSDGTGATSYTYNADGWLTGKTFTPTSGTAQVWVWGYDAEGNVTSRQRPDTTTETWTYDAAGQPTQVVSPVGTTTFAFDDAGNQTVTTNPNGTTETRAWDAVNALSSITTKKGSTVLTSQTVTRDAANQPTQTVVVRSSSSETRKYLYDANERITDVCYTTATCTTTAAQQHWTYDTDGNRLTERNGTGTGTTTTWVYDSSDRTTSQKVGTAAATAPTYDTDGNILTDGNGRTYTYNLDGKPVTAVASGSTVTYTYDGDGNRLTANVTAGTGVGKTVSYTWDTNAPLPVLVTTSSTPSGGSATVTSLRYDHGGTGWAISQTVAGVNGWFSHDPLGSETDIVNPSGAIIRSEDFTPYGTTRTAIGAGTQSGAGFALGWVGTLPNADGTDYMRARDYNVNLGEFNTRDPLADQGSAGYGGWWGTQYGYVNGRVAVATDPSGLDTQGTCANLTLGFAGGWTEQICLSWDSEGNVAVVTTQSPNDPRDHSPQRPGVVVFGAGASVGGQVTDAHTIYDTTGPFKGASGNVDFVGGGYSSGPAPNGSGGTYNVHVVDVNVGVGTPLGGSAGVTTTTIRCTLTGPGWMKKGIAIAFRVNQIATEATNPLVLIFYNHPNF